MVCMGNICRSPMAQGVFERVVAEHALEHRIEIDSAGTHAYHVGEPPDERARRTAAARGIDLSRQRARKVARADFERFDYVLAMDRDNLSILSGLCPRERRERLRLFLDFAERWPGEEVPDPYYGGEAGFERVMDMVEDAARGLLAEIRARHGL
ncbi:MAG: low molecular weight phosphotyrosine protein phosphatase [Chromatiales bacterium]|nr:low molecular weight phosphotyrosine protein phosphatase [Chromatiales bacterium]